MKLIFLGNNNPKIFKRGVENVIYSQAKSFQLGPKYYIYFGDENMVHAWDDIICISIKKDWKRVLKLNLIIRRLKEKDRVIIHSHGPVRTLFCLYKTDILTVHDAIYYQRKGLKQRFNKIFYLVEKLAYRKSRKIHFISKYTLSESLYSCSEKKSIIIYNTTPLEPMIRQHTYIADASNNKTYNILAVRGIQERTRIDLLIDFAMYCENKNFYSKKINIIVAGKGKLLEYYRKKIQKLGLTNIHLIGYISDYELSDLYNTCDCVILTCSHAEGFGLPIIEGYCSNKLVIGSNKCAVPEIIINSEFLFENNPKSIYNTLLKAYKLKDRFDFKKYYIDNFSMQHYMDEFSKLYNNLV